MDARVGNVCWYELSVHVVQMGSSTGTEMFRKRLLRGVELLQSALNVDWLEGAFE